MSSTSLGLPTLRDNATAPIPEASTAGVQFSAGHHFNLLPGTTLDEVVAGATSPLSVILQVTKRCDFDCTFCSEIVHIKDSSMAQLETMARNLAGVSRVFLSGGEPLLRKDFPEIVDLFSDHIIGVPTNATRGVEQAEKIAGKVAFVNVGLEGPRATTKRVRGDYDQVMRGIQAFKAAGLPLSLSSVVYRSTLSTLPYLVQIADVIEAGKVKLIMPLRKGNALNLDEQEFITNEEAGDAFSRLQEQRTTNMWTPALRMTTWTPATEGHMIVIEPNGEAHAWPVYDAKDLWEPLGNVLTEPISAIWERYRFKTNHFRKYLGSSIRTIPNAAGGEAGV
jgi:MoaA/NifB/PqqE/SkfB family radical SAM enzyme